MCSLAVILRSSKRYPLVAAANRDESRLRLSRAPFLWETRPRILAGRDETQGGTWMGVNDHGLFAALTNLWTGKAPDSGRGSRGQFLIRLLACRNLEEAERTLEGEDPEATNPFILACADRQGGGFWTSTARDLQAADLPPGAHLFGNLLPGDPAHHKADGALRRIGEAWDERESDEPGAAVPALAAALREHTGGAAPEASVCVHTAGVYGTVSSTILLAGPDSVANRFLYASGPPCVTPYQDLSGLLRALWR